MTENTFVDGASLDEMFPQIDSALAQYETEMQAEIDRYNFDAIKMPTNLKRRKRRAPVVATYDSSDYYYEYESDMEPSCMEKTAEKIREVATANGYDEEEVETLV